MAMTLVIIGIILVTLFSIAFFTRRRFGVLGLALAAGTVLSQYASGYVGNFLKNSGLAFGLIDYGVVASIVLIVSPALLLLAGGPTYRDKKAAIVGATGFALLGMFFVIGPLSTVVPTYDPLVRDTLVVMAALQNYVIIAALVFALIDTFMIHGTIGRRYHKDKKH